nr:uncharacterized protein LOC129256683 [Lytechinus pictus]
MLSDRVNPFDEGIVRPLLVNKCSYNELVGIPGVSHYVAGLLLECKGGITREYFNSLVSVPQGVLDHLDFTPFCMAPQHTVEFRQGSPYTPPVRTPPQASLVPPTQLLATESPQSSITQPTQLSATPSLRILPAPEAHMPMVGYPRVPQQQWQVVQNQAAPPQSAPPQMQAAPLPQSTAASLPHALPHMSTAPPPQMPAAPPPQPPAALPLQPTAVPSYQMAMALSSKVPSPRHALTNPVQGLSPALQPAPSQSWLAPPHQSTIHQPPQSPTTSQSSGNTSRHKTTGRSRQMGSQSLSHMGSLPKTINFDGRGSWRGFYLKFMAYADEMGWSSIQRKYQMWWCMKDVGSDYFSLLMTRDRDMSFEDLVRRMERRFGADDPLEIAQMEFIRAHQLAEEEIIEWADRVVSLATKTFPGVPEYQVQRQGVLKFCQGCSDKEAGLHALNLRPDSVEKAVDHVTWYLHSRKMVYGRLKRPEVKLVTRPPEDWSSEDATIQQIGAPLPANKTCLEKNNSVPGTSSKISLEGESLTKWVSALDNRTQVLAEKVSYCDRKFEKLQSSMDNLNIRMSQIGRRGRSPSPAPRTEGCFKCGKPGHFMRDCPDKGPEASVSVLRKVEASNLSESEEEREATPWLEHH